MGSNATPSSSASNPPTISRVEVLRRRSLNARQQIRYLRDCHWAFLEDLRVRLRDYYWRFGVSPLEDDEPAHDIDDPSRRKKRRRGDAVCAFPGCKSIPMELTAYCHLHILSDPNQTLYKPCSYIIKSGAAGPVLCWKPVLRSTDPVLCSVHFQKAQRHASQALKKAGSNLTSPNRPAPKLHVIIAEYVRQIQSKRRETKRAASESTKHKGKNIN